MSIKSHRSQHLVPAFICGVLSAVGPGIGTAHADASESAEIAAVHNASVAPVDAVALAEKHSGGRAFGMGLEASHRKSWYEIQLDVHGNPMLARIDPRSGAWLGMAPAHGDDASGMHSLDGHKVSLAQAITAAERVAAGRALEAGPFGHGKSAHYDVDVVRSNLSVAHLSVNPDTGVVSKAPDSEID